MTNEREYKETFQVSDHPQFDIRNIRGRTEISSWDRPEIQVTAYKRAKSEQSAESTTVDMGQEGDRVWVKTRFPADGDWLNLINWKQPATVDYTVRVPRQCEISASTVSGETIIEDIESTVKQNAVSGEARLVDIRGKLVLNSVSGKISGERLKGKVKVNTVSGDVNLRASDLLSLRGNTVSGDIRAETRLYAQGSYHVSSVSGDLRLTVPIGTQCTAKLATLSGDLRAALPHEILEDKRTVKRFRINGGGVLLEMNSVSGDLRLVTEESIETMKPVESVESPPPDAEASTPPPPPKPPAVQESRTEETVDTTSRMDILKAIDSGDLSVEEGLAKLHDLGFEE